MDEPQRRVLITGGAGGIGTAICEEIARSSARVIIADLDLEAARALADRLPDAVAMKVDLDSPDSIASFAAELLEAEGGIDVLVNNAGLTQVERFLDSNDSAWDRQWRINLRAPMQLCRLLAPGMVERNWGRIVFIASDSARAGCSGEVAYSATKAGLLGAAKSVARELARNGVTANVVSPGPIDTPMLRAVQTESPEMIERLTRQIPMRRIGTAAEVAATVAFLCGEGSGYVTGQVLSVNGGVSMA